MMRLTISSVLSHASGTSAKSFAHLLRALHVELIGEELHPARVGDGLARADARSTSCACASPRER